MKKTKPLVPLFTILFIVTGYSNSAKGQVQGKWSGRITLVEIVTGTGDFRREKKVFVDITDNEATGTVTDIGESNLGNTNCAGSGKAILAHVSINYGDKTYNIHVMSPPCNGTSFSKLSGETTPFGPEITDIVISEKPLINSNLLEGIETRTADIVPGSYTGTTTISWNLKRTIDVVLIVTPSGKDGNGVSRNYDSWLPEPGKDEMRKGSVMNISLKVQRRNGQPSTLKAKSFELRLSNTSTEPGITINFPLNPANPGLPDLRFIGLPLAESNEEDQIITIPSADGVTGKAYIGSYDGGGWTTLTAEAVLKDDTRIKGNLLVPGGETEIPIPKRILGTKIGTAWLTANVTANGNPREMDDIEKSKENNNYGDGLTVYEEYRGVISKAEFGNLNLNNFGRLDPNKKELGVKIKKSELPLLSEGFKWFENASDIKVIRFVENEIGNDRRLNKNFKTPHDYDQYILKVEKGDLPENILGKTYPDPGLPANTRLIIINSDRHPLSYLFWQTQARILNARMPFTPKDWLALTVAHELSHGVNCLHHGNIKSVKGAKAQKIFDDAGIKYKIIRYDGSEISPPYAIKGYVAKEDNMESGDLFCIMAYQPYNLWSISIKNGVPHFNMIPNIFPLGNIMCKSAAGTGINQKDINGYNDFFGDAAFGNGDCIGQIKLRD